MIQTSTYSASTSAECRLKRGNPLGPFRKPTTYPKLLEAILSEQWKRSKPHWFITVQWSPAAPDFKTASSHSRLFRNKLLTAIYDCRLKEIPDSQDRCRLIWFHERAEDPSGRLIYHTHLHLTELPAPYITQQKLELLILKWIAPGFRCLRNLYRKKDPAVVVKP